MATNTSKYNFKKPDESDFYSIQDQNGNWDKAEVALADLDTPTFEDYTGATPIPSAETALAAMVSKGKISQFFSNVKAFCKGATTIGMLVNNCVTNNPNLPLSAAQGKVLMDLFTKLNSDLGDKANKTDLNAVQTNLTQKSQSAFYTIADVTGLSTGQVTNGYHNVSKMSNGQFRYSAHFTCYPNAIPSGNIIGYLPNEANPYQVVYDYVYDTTSKNWVRIKIGNTDRSIQLMNLDGTNVTSTQVSLEFHMDF